MSHVATPHTSPRCTLCFIFQKIIKHILFALKTCISLKPVPWSIYSLETTELHRTHSQGFDVLCALCSQGNLLDSFLPCYINMS